MSFARLFQCVLLTFGLASNADGFRLGSPSPKTDIRFEESGLVGSFSEPTSRKGFIQHLALVPLVAGVATSADPAFASGGATAGGAYLLSAKQRYNERVKASVNGLLAAVDDLSAGNSKVAKAFFASEEGGGWKDLTAAGYLLSNAFRRNSTASPDSLPAVKKYKAFAAEVDNLQKVLKKKGAAAAANEIPKVEAALDTWLSEIDLPSAKEL